MGLIAISYRDGDGEASSGESVFLYKFPVYTGDLGSRVDESIGVNVF